MNQSPLLIYPKEVQKLLGVGSTKFYEFCKLPDFPKPKNPLGKRPMYRRDEIEEWVKSID